MNTKFLINTLIVLLVIVVLFILYFQFFNDPEATPELIRSGGDASEFASAEQSEFLVLLNVVRNIEFDKSILSSEKFTTGFKDFTTNLPNLISGRRNPFAEYGVGNYDANVSALASPATPESSSASTTNSQTTPLGE